MTKSAFPVQDRYNIRYGASGFVLAGTYRMPSGVESRFSVRFSSGEKKLLRDDKPYERISDHIGLLPVVMISPGDISLVRRFAEKSGMNPMEVVESFREDFWNEMTPGEYNRLLTLLIEKAVVWNDRLEIEFKTAGIRSLMEGFRQ